MSPESVADIQKVLTSTPPALTGDEALGIAASRYGMIATAHPLDSERDQNFRLDTEDGQRFTLKISNPAEQEEVVDFQNRALLHVAEKDASLPLPRVIPDLDGQWHCSVEINGEAHFVRVLSWLDGEVLNDATVDANLAGRLGNLLARLGLALKGFDHPGSNPPLLWDMKRASGLRELLPHIKDPVLRPLISQTLDHFDSKVKPVLDTLRTQVIHNDMNPGNVLMDSAHPGRVSGIIDFGDMVRSPLIIDLAVAAAYQLSDGEDPLGDALPMIAGYHAIRPLQQIEMELLTGLIKTRLISSLLIASYRVSLFPENRDYLMISHESAKNYLFALNRLPDHEALQQIYAACAAA